MAYRIAINGYGRIGRLVLRAFYESANHDPLSIVAINDLADPQTVAHLTRYDSTHGRFPGDVAVRDAKAHETKAQDTKVRDAATHDTEVCQGTLSINSDDINLHSNPDIRKLPWQKLGIDLVMECSGAFNDRPTAEQHLAAGAKKVLFSQPAQPDVDATIVYGINHQSLTAQQRILSNASCTTNCIVPVLQTIDDAFAIKSGLITTIHSAMNDQPVLDSYHNHDLHKTRSAMQSIIPVDTALAIGITRILPQLKGRLEAQAIRVPVINVSAMDLSLQLGQNTSTDEVNKAIKQASTQLPHNVLGHTEEPLASCDFNHDPRSAIVALNQTRVAGGNLLKLLVWFDNEWAYANRMLDVAQHLTTLTE
ncbi:MAG: type I glyceraldehyde-3-phosphate dehydrogenase [Pseudohongiellaceae bacterium]